MSYNAFEELQNILIRANEISVRKKRIEHELEVEKKAVTKEITVEMERLGLTRYEFETDADNDLLCDGGKRKIVCRKVTPTKIEYDAEKIYEAFKGEREEIRNKIVTKNYIVQDMQGLIQLLKSYGVKPKEFKSFIKVEKEVNKQALENFYSLGVVTLDDLNGCYATIEGKSYWNVKATSVKEGD